jgi:ABC-type lipoprotein release transport system permease subunit
MKTLIKLAWRNIWRNKRRSFISIASVLFAVLFAISADSFERGSYELMIKNMIKLSTGYIQIQDVLYEEEPSIDNLMLYDESIKSVISDFEDEIDYTVPRIQSFALAATDEKTRGTMVMGIDPESENRFNDFSENIVKGDFFDAQDQSVIVAEGLANILGLEVGDTLILIGQGFQGLNASGMYPIKGIVKLSLQELNNNAVYMPLNTAQWFYAADDRISSLIIMPKNPRNTNEIATRLNEKLDSELYVALTWEEMMKDFLKMMQLDTAGNKIIGYILYIVIGFGLFGTILTMMLERIKEFSMLISIGMKRFQLAIVCLLESIFLSFIGVVLGLIITFPIMLYLNINPIQLTGEMADMMLDYGFEAVMPTSISPSIFISQAITVFVLALLIGLYPVYKVFKLKLTNK